MKKTTWLLCAVALISLIVLFTGCPEPKTETVSVTERMTMFMADLNAGNYLSLKAHLHPDSNLYSQPNQDFWGTYFDSAIPLGSLSPSVSSATALDVSGTITFAFTLKEDGTGIYKILTISQNGSQINP